MTDENVSLTVKTLKNMYVKKAITIQKVKALYNTKVITLEEYNYILGKE